MVGCAFGVDCRDYNPMNSVAAAPLVKPAKGGIQNIGVRANTIKAGKPWMPTKAGMTVATRLTPTICSLHLGFTLDDPVSPT